MDKSPPLQLPSVTVLPSCSSLLLLFTYILDINRCRQEKFSCAPIFPVKSTGSLDLQRMMGHISKLLLALILSGALVTYLTSNVNLSSVGNSRHHLYYSSCKPVACLYHPSNAFYTSVGFLRRLTGH